MTDGGRNEYRPDVVSRPGDTLREVLAIRGINQRQLALRAGRPVKTINEIIKGKLAITAETALGLERVLGVPASFWIKREQDYQEFLARQKERAFLRPSVAWLKQIPIKEMVKYGWIREFADRIEQMREVLSFFGVRAPAQYSMWWQGLQVSFRKSACFEVNPDALAAWLRKGELEALSIHCEPFNGERFKATLGTIRSLTFEPPEHFKPQLTTLCASCGVAVVFVPELPKTRTNGATRWLTPTKALIQLSFRYKRDDVLWFTFFHEAGHILLHGKRHVFLHDENYEGNEEQEANRFAEDILIPPKALSEFKNRGERSELAVRSFARNIGISPGIVVGRLQNDDYLPRTHLNLLKRRLDWTF